MQAMARRRALTTVTLLEAALPLGAGAWLMGRVRSLPPGTATPGEGNAPVNSSRPGPSDPSRVAASPRIAVVIPARNEERALPGLLASLANQSLRPDEIIVVDDDSSDGTGAVARSAGATVVNPPSLPPGWLGKTWACHHGAMSASAGLLLFLDADVILAPAAVAAIVAEHARQGGLVSAQPAHLTVDLYEQLSAVCNVVTMMGTGSFSWPPRRPVSMAFGPCLLIARDDYQAVGGHAHPAVRLQVAEDIALARRMRELGRPVSVLAGGELVGFRMYPDGLGQLVEGWTKMIGNGARLTSMPLQLAVTLWVTGALLGARRGISVLVALSTRRVGRDTAVDAAVYATWVVEMSWLMGQVGRWRRITPLAFPVPLVAFVALMVRSGLLVARHRPATWRGRVVPVR
jgi:4,4'-diaponeurosporenoate glycosyltransferase